MGPQNGVVGDNTNFGTELPTTMPPEQDLTEEKNMAKFSQSAEFKRLEEYAKGRIEFYQKYLPNGDNLLSADVAKAKEMWIPANIVIGEFNALLSAYTNAKDAVNKALDQ